MIKKSSKTNSQFLNHYTKKKFSIKDFCSKCDQIRVKLRIWSHLLQKSLMENFFFVQCTFRLRKLFWETKVFLFFKFFSENGLISSNQSGYNLGGSYVNQLLSVADDIYKSLDRGYDVKGVFLDNLTRFSTVMSCSNWKKGISGNAYNFAGSFRWK